jgi:hypothetical protein
MGKSCVDRGHGERESSANKGNYKELSEVIALYLLNISIRYRLSFLGKQFQMIRQLPSHHPKNVD